MGHAAAKNIVNDSISEIVNVINSSTQTCQTSVSQNESFSICYSKGVTVSGNFIDMNEAVIIDSACVSKNISNTTTTSAVDTSISQITKAIVSNLGLGTADAANLTTLMTNLQTSIINSYSQTCVEYIQQNESFSLCNDDGVVVQSNIVFENELSDNLVSCIQQDKNVNTVTESIVQLIAQKAEATVTNELGMLLLLLLVIAAICAIVTFGAPALLLFIDWKVVAVLCIFVFLILVGYFSLAYWQKWFPFHKTA